MTHTQIIKHVMDFGRSFLYNKKNTGVFDFQSSVCWLIGGGFSQKIMSVVYKINYNSSEICRIIMDEKSSNDRTQGTQNDFNLTKFLKSMQNTIHFASFGTRQQFF